MVLKGYLQTDIKCGHRPALHPQWERSILGSRYMYRGFQEGTKDYERNSKDKLYLLRQKYRMKGPFYIKSSLPEWSFFVLTLTQPCRC